jgi:hypothetical protein
MQNETVTCQDRLPENIFAPTSGTAAFIADLLYSFFDGAGSLFLVEGWFLDSTTDVSAGELTFVTVPAA